MADDAYGCLDLLSTRLRSHGVGLLVQEVHIAAGAPLPTHTMPSFTAPDTPAWLAPLSS
jgi:hypothetical protein